MKIYRIFTNDRGAVDGVKMYSVLTQTAASSPDAAEAEYKKYGTVKAIEWPPDGGAQKWLNKHVGPAK